MLVSTRISIHALTRSATMFHIPIEDVDKISIHALTRSATDHDIVVI